MIAFVLATVAACMMVEAWISRAHERVLVARGAVEPSGDVYRVMQVAYPACFVAMAIEGAIRGAAGSRALESGAILFLGAKALKYWAIASLGERWTFRVLVPPGEKLVTTGPYRLLKHPNYVAVLGELVSVAIMLAAPMAGLLSVAGFGGLIAARVRVEERALNRPQSRG